MNYKNFIQTLGFTPKENTSGVFHKKYNGYAIEVDFEKKVFNFGNTIKGESKTTQNFSQAENWVVLECVDRLLEKGYLPENIVLEKTWRTGQGTSGRLDILVTRDNGSAYLMIECKTWGAEFDKEAKNMERNGGQLFTYFQQDKDADVLMLYTSHLQGKGVDFKNIIIKIEEDYRQAGNVKDLFSKWNKHLYQKGVWEAAIYNFEIKTYTKNDLSELNEEAGKKLFNGFASILRKHSVSDKPNAFNVIFNLFLAKLFDEQKRDTDPLEFRWYENDDPVDFQVRLYNLHKEGLYDFLKKEIEGIQNSDFNAKTLDELKQAKKKFLKFNKLFDIKSVLDDNDFEQNHRVLKEVVELIQDYQIRYPRKQRYLSDFFELLLTTGLKQEVGQYFTPPPITKFIVKSLPIQQMMEAHINQPTPSLPAVIDYAVGSGHFITEIMEEYQDIINQKIDTTNFFPKAKQEMRAWQADPYCWAAKYIYGVEKDYRLVKVAKVGCYFYGDGLAQIIHGDGLDSFENSKSYVGLLKENTNLEDSTKAKFSIVLSNPPYSVSGCKDDLEYIQAQKDFTLYNALTDRSSEIECLFVERTKQLLKDGGVAGIILPSSILSNTGIYTQAREILLKHFEIVAIAELGSNTFMATGTNTVTLFLRRRNNQDAIKIEAIIKNSFDALQDLSVKDIEKPIAKYLAHVWGSISFDDYKTLLQKTPNKNIEQHEIYTTYTKKIKAKNETERWAKILATEQEKLLYFLLAYQQKVVLVKTGEKDAEKRFLGYEFSNRRGSEGIHPIQRSKSIDDCTQLYDADSFTNPEKASYYIYKAFLNEYDLAIAENLQQNVSYNHLVDMLTFDRADFEKNISLSAKKKVKIKSRWEQVLFTNSLQNINGETVKIEKYKILEIGKFPVVTQEKEKLVSGYSDEPNPVTDLPIILFGDHSCTLKYLDFKFFRGADGTVLLKPSKEFLPKYFFNVLYYSVFDLIEKRNKYERHYKYLQSLYLPLPPLGIQQKVVSEIEALEKQEQKAVEEMEKLKVEINTSVNDLFKKSYKVESLGNLTILITKGSSPTWQGIAYTKNQEVLFVTSENVREGFLEFNKKKYLEHRFSEIQKRSILEKNDILINIVGASIGRSAVFNLDVSANINQAVALVRCNPDLLNYQFLNYFLNSDSAISEYTSMKKEVARANLSLQNISDIKIPLPPLSEQKAIVAEIEKIEAQIAELQQQIAEIPTQKEAILKKYL